MKASSIIKQIDLIKQVLEQSFQLEPEKVQRMSQTEPPKDQEYIIFAESLKDDQGSRQNSSKMIFSVVYFNNTSTSVYTCLENLETLLPSYKVSIPKFNHMDNYVAFTIK